MKMGIHWVLFITMTTSLTVMMTNVDGKMANWSDWSAWSPCSRSCEGGISVRKRHCFSAPDKPSKLCHTNDTLIRGYYMEVVEPGSEEQEYTICNLQRCPPVTPTTNRMDFRSQQCMQYNDVPYEGQYYSWTAYIDATYPCQLYCQASSEVGLVVKMDDKVIDGTRCKMDSLDMCIAGHCKIVGCDLKIGSKKQVDACGVCGGDSLSCSASTFVWGEVPLSQCSAQCGGGYMMVRPVCKNNLTDVEVEQGLCDNQKRPESRMASCNQNACPARWEVDDWGVCSQSCGTGYRFRHVDCVIDKGGKKIKVKESECPDLRPPDRESCNMESCPQWYTGIWSECNAPCGQGLQHRNVICRDHSGRMSTACSPIKKPASRQPCTGSCDVTSGSDSDEVSMNGQQKVSEEDEEDEEDNTDAKTTSLSDPHPQSGWMRIDAMAQEHEEQGEEEEQAAPSENQMGETTVAKEASSKATTSARQQPEQQHKNQVTTEPSFIVEDWDACSVPCGEGIRKRKVECKIFLEFSKTVATLPDKSCPGPKPTTTEICYAGLCDLPANHDDSDVANFSLNNMQQDEVRAYALISPLATEQQSHLDTLKGQFVWKEVGFTACSESCLGGLQESKVICINSKSSSDSPVSPMHCDPAQHPEIIVRTCNDHPCPPRWNVSDFSRCSKSCGGGTQLRSVNCIQEVRHGGNNILKVADHLCPQPPPTSQQFCNVLDCPAQWTTSAWTKCSRKCGGGSRYRKVRCQQLLALGELADKHDSQCPGKKPTSQKPCNVDVCQYEYVSASGSGGAADHHQEPKIRSNLNQQYVQASPDIKSVRLKVGGKATLYKGTNVKIRCPVKRFDRFALEWFKDNRIVLRGKQSWGRDRRHIGSAFINNKGALRIRRIDYLDAGVYMCAAGKSKASIEIIVKGVESYKAQNNVYMDIAESTTDSPALKSSYDYERKFMTTRPYFQPPNEINDWKIYARHSEDQEVSNRKSENEWRRFNEVDPLVNDDDDDSERSYPAGSDGASSTNTLDTLTSGSDGDSVPNHFLLIMIILVAQALTSSSGSSISGQDYMDEEEEDEVEDMKLSRNGLRLKWSIHEWSKCSKTCGQEGKQIRDIKCVVMAQDETEQILPNAFCVDNGLVEPESEQSCGLLECPAWMVSDWKPCHDSKCIARNIGFQVREVHCGISNRTRLDENYCESVLKPKTSRTCNNKHCKAVWLAHEWSKCNATCGLGHRRRDVACVWKHDGESAGSHCRQKKKPLETIECQVTQDCIPAETDSPKFAASSSEPCIDTSKYCSLVTSFDMCSSHKYRLQCCHSCMIRNM